MGKKALCIRFDDAPDEVKGVKSLGRVALWSEFYDTPTVLADRDTCETDPSLLQLIPYITVKDHLGRVLSYSRGKGGNEERLHAKLSIGLGGHVDTEVPEGLTLLEHLQAEGARELLEETGVVVTEPLQFKALLVDRTCDVGHVHLGLHCCYQLAEGQVLTLENDVVEHGTFYRGDELNDAKVFNRLENWSQTVALTLY